jgi:hypothetical protein
LPAPLTHGENIYFVSEEIESVRRAIIEITEDSVLRNRLEKGALAYYNKYIEPRSAIERILQK